MNWVISVKKSIMFIFVMLFMFCVGCLGVKAAGECEYLDRDGNLAIRFDYIPSGTLLTNYTDISDLLNIEILNVDYKGSFQNITINFLYGSQYAYVVSSNNYCPNYLTMETTEIKISPTSPDSYSGFNYTHNIVAYNENVALDNYNFYYRKDLTPPKYIVKTVSYTLDAGTDSEHKQDYVNVIGEVGHTIYSLTTYSDNTYRICVSNAPYETLIDGVYVGYWEGESTEHCMNFNTLTNVPTVTVNNIDFTVSSSAAQRLFDENVSNYYFRKRGDVIELGLWETSSSSGTNQGPQDFEGNLGVTPVTFCEEEGVQKTFQVIGYILFVAKIIIPLILIILGSIDFAKATISSDEKAPKDAIMALTRRIIIAIIIFLIPTILNFLLSLVNGASEAFNDSNFTDCTNCLFDPFGNECQPGNPLME